MDWKLVHKNKWNQLRTDQMSAEDAFEELCSQIVRSSPPSGAILLKTMPQLFLTKVHKKKEGKNEGVFAVISSDEVGTQ